MKRYKDIVGDGGSGIVGQAREQQRRLAERLALIRHVVAILSGKGGVGKSSVTANLAVVFARDGLAVGVLDADLNGPSIAKMLGVRGRPLPVAAVGVTPPRTAEGIRVMSMDLLLPSDETPVTWRASSQAESHVWRGSMEANALREFLADTAWGGLDLLLVDLPPGADRLTTLAGLVPALSGSIVVSIPSEVSYLVVKKSISVARELRVPILGLVENMAGYVCGSCGEVGPLFSGAPGDRVADGLGIPFLGRIPFDPRLALTSDQGIPFAGQHPESPGAQAFLQIANRIKAALDPAVRA
jgi:ATP-binding protein involved in chromosome partitioning